MAAAVVVLAVASVVLAGVAVRAARRAADATARAQSAEAARDDAHRAAASAAAARQQAEAAEVSARQRAERAEATTAAFGELVAALWSLELLRHTRTWQLVSAGGPGPDTVAVDTAAELAAALGMELAVVREEAGVPGDLEGGAPHGVSVPAALLGLRLAEEVVAGVVREADGFVVRLSGDDGSLRIRIVPDAGAARVPDVLARVADAAGAELVAAGGGVEVVVPLVLPGDGGG